MKNDLTSKSPISIKALCIDSGNAGHLADFYAKLLNWEKTYDGNGWAVIKSPDNSRIINFQTVDDYLPPVWPWEKGKQLQMMHLYFSADDINSAIEYAIDCGATIANTQYYDISKTMLDPAGHPFCLGLKR